MAILQDPELQSRIEILQEESRNFIELIIKASKNPNLSYQDCQNIFFFAKIAELERKLAENK